MSVDLEILKTVSTMPPSLKQEVLHYAKYLMKNYTQNSLPKSDQLSVKKRRSGILKGTFILPLSDDFDEPLDDFKEYYEL
jgi:hypothetical protein